MKSVREKGQFGIFALVLAIMMFIPTCRTAAANNDGQIVFAGNQSGSYQLYTMRPDGSNVRQITNMPPTEVEIWTPDISPDGRHIVFCYGQGKLADNPPVDIYTIDVDGSNLKRITQEN